MSDGTWKRTASIAMVVAGLGAVLGVAASSVAVPAIVRAAVRALPVEAFRAAGRGGERAADRMISSYLASSLAPESTDAGEGDVGGGTTPGTASHQSSRSGDDGGGTRPGTASHQSSRSGDDGGGTTPGTASHQAGGSGDEGVGTTPGTASHQAGGSGDDGTTPGTASHQGGGSANGAEESRAVVISREELERRLQRPAQVTKKIAIAETPKGLRIRRLEGYFGELGLRPGDLVTEVGGESVRTRQRAISLIRERRDQSTFRLGLVREGREMELTVRVPKFDVQRRVE